jgi:hypothetical protein
MGRFVILSVLAALLSGCSGGTATQSSLSPLGTLAQHSRSFAPQANCAAHPGGTGILADGDFSQAPDPGNTYIRFFRGQVFAPSWQVVKRNIDFVGSNSWGPTGFCSVDLDGNHVGGIGHSGFQTKPGAAYTVTFLLSGNSDCPPTVKTMKVLAADQFAAFSWDTSNGNDAQHDKFATETWGFTAAKPVTTLKFESTDPLRSPGCGAVVAAISVTRN